MSQADIGLVGLAVMGQNLVLNMADHGLRVAVFNRTTSKVDEFLEGPAKGSAVAGAHSIEELTSKLASDPDMLVRFFEGDTGGGIDGFLKRLDDTVDAYTAEDGLIKSWRPTFDMTAEANAFRP